MQLAQNLMIWATPVAHLGVSILSLHFALHCSHQQARTVLILLHFTFAVLSFMTSTKIPLACLASLWAQSMALNIVHVFSILFIEKIPAPSMGKAHLISARGICSTYRLWANPRLLPAVNAPNDKRDHDTERPVFLFICFSRVVMYYSLHNWVLPFCYKETIRGILPSDVTRPALLTRWDWEITPREIIVRSYMAVSWVWDSLVFLDGANATLAMFFVGVGFDSPGDWPQLFGSFNEACGLRNFWGRYWHKLALRPYRNCGLVASTGLKYLPYGDVLERKLSNGVVAFVVFLLSGLSHAAVAWRLGMHDWLDVKWFLLNFTACFIEKLVLSWTRYIATAYGLEKDFKIIERSFIGKMVGYAWVFIFFFWSVPLWLYPRYDKAFSQAQRRSQ